LRALALAAGLLACAGIGAGLSRVPEPRAGGAVTTAAASPQTTCAQEGCGCPHATVVESCCCAPEEPGVVDRAPLPRPSRALTSGPAVRAPWASPKAAAFRAPLGVLVGFHCSGGTRRGVAPRLGSTSVCSLENPPAVRVAPPRIAAPTPVARPRTIEDREPPTPPPRNARRA